MEKFGDLAAFGTAVCWTISALFFERVSRRFGALAVNFYKVLGAFVLLSAAAWILMGKPFPTDAPARSWLYLSLSGFIGFVIADYFLFNAYILIGSRITVIFQALTPLFTAAIAFLLLGESMRLERLAGMALVIAGILLVVLSKQESPGIGGKTTGGGGGNTSGRSTRGYAFAFLAAIFQAIGLIFSKVGLGSYNAISGTQIRILTAIAGFALQTVLLRQTDAVFRAPLRDKPGMGILAAGAVFGPFLGVTLSLFALQNTNAGAASTLMALTPILIIPPSIILLKQKVKPLELAGAALAVSGAALFFML